MTCRICDSAVREEQVEFVTLLIDNPIFRVRCRHCGMTTLVDDHNDVVNPERLTSITSADSSTPKP